MHLQIVGPSRLCICDQLGPNLTDLLNLADFLNFNLADYFQQTFLAKITNHPPINVKWGRGFIMRLSVGLLLIK